MNELTDEQRIRNSPNHGPVGELPDGEGILRATQPGTWTAAIDAGLARAEYHTTPEVRERFRDTLNSTSRYDGGTPGRLSDSLANNPTPSWMNPHGVTQHGDYMGLPVYTHPDMPADMAFFVTREPIVLTPDDSVARQRDRDRRVISNIWDPAATRRALGID